MQANMPLFSFFSFSNNSRQLILTGTIAFKLIILALFSSGYQADLFYPFVQHFVRHLDNPWQYFFEAGNLKVFPYPPLMLYLLAPGALLSKLSTLPLALQNLFFKLPTLLADILIFVLLLRMFPTKGRAVFLLYFLSPIILFASYIHSQLDLIPTALLLLSAYLLTKQRIFWASAVFGLAISVKFHVIAALPLFLIYLVKNKRNPLWFLVAPPGLYLLIALPFIGSTGYQQLVLNNAEQLQVFSVYFRFETLKLYLAPLALFIIYARFLGYPKINKDLLLSAMGLLFTVFIYLVPPMPGWYVWVLPFAIISLINLDSKNLKTAMLVNLALSATYLLYFVCFHQSQFHDILFLGHPLDLTIANEQFRNLAFTGLEGCLLANIYFLYRFGVRSNSVYKQKDGAFVIGIGGDSGAGKTTLLIDIKALLTEQAVLEVEGDGDHKWERGDKNWHSYTHLNPKANYLHRQSDNLIALKQGNTIQRVEYDHASGKFTAPQTLSATDYIVMSGLHPFYLPKMRRAIDLKIFLETDERLRRHWKVRRDMAKRGYSAERVLTQIEIRMTDAEKYIWPQKQYADLVINYFSQDDFLIGDPETSPSLTIKITVDSSIDLEPLIDELHGIGIPLSHDYSDDLKTQYLQAEAIHLNADFEAIAERIITNQDEVLSPGAAWRPDDRGLVQLILLLMISEKRKEATSYDF